MTKQSRAMQTTHDQHQINTQAVESLMAKAMDSKVPLIQHVGRHILDGGKRIRPQLVLLMGACCDLPNNQATHIAAITEFMHTATLLHDDVVDHATARRGKSSANTLWGNEMSVLVGDYLYSRTFNLLIELGDIKLMSILAQASQAMAEGEVLQLSHCHDPSLTEADYNRIIEAKTARLFSASADMCTQLAQGRHAQALHDFAHHFGMAFQLSDDSLDYMGDSTLMGKHIGDDLSDGKTTLPLIYLIHHGTAAQKQLAEQAVREGDRQYLPALQQAIADSQAIAYTCDKAQRHIELGLHALKQLPNTPHKDQLIKQLTQISTRLC
jgi:octaprenyl-diphosphate synthase